MSCAKNARQLANYIVNLPEINKVSSLANKFSYYHIGALYTDVVLQAGLNYQSVVKPRVQRVLLNYPEDYSVTKFKLVIEREGLEKVINWKHDVKLARLHRLLEFSDSNGIDICADLKAFFLQKDSYDVFLSLDGFGPKSLDYLLKLLNVDTVAVDRHIYSFVKMANIDAKGYQENKRIVEFAADLLSLPRSAVDQIIWNYMSKKEYEIQVNTCQYSIPFPDQNIEFRSEPGSS